MMQESEVGKVVNQLLEQNKPAPFADLPFKPSVAIDLDDTLIEYEHGYFEKGIFGEPKVGAVEFTKRLREAGFNVGIYTCRKDVNVIRDYLDKHGFIYDWVNENPANDPAVNSAKPVAIAYVDDRGVVADGDFDRMLADVVKLVEKAL